MKKRVVGILCFAMLSLLATAGKAHAQAMTFKAHVPFPFVVGNQRLPAGTYQIQRLLGRPGESDQVGIIVMRSTDPRVYKAVTTNLVDQPTGTSHTQLAFAAQGGQHYLAEVRIEGEKSQQIPKVFPEAEPARLEAPRDEVVLAELH